MQLIFLLLAFVVCSRGSQDTDNIKGTVQCFSYTPLQNYESTYLHRAEVDSWFCSGGFADISKMKRLIMG